MSLKSANVFDLALLSLKSANVLEYFSKTKTSGRKASDFYVKTSLLHAEDCCNNYG